MPKNIIAVSTDKIIRSKIVLELFDLEGNRISGVLDLKGKEQCKVLIDTLNGFDSIEIVKDERLPLGLADNLLKVMDDLEYDIMRELREIREYIKSFKEGDSQ